MVDTLIPAEDGQPITAETTNLNNNFLLNAINSAKQTLDSSLKSVVVSLQTNIKSVQQTLQKNIDNLSNDMNTKFNNRIFVQKELNIEVGTTNLSSYLPKDGKQYLVFLNAWIGYKGGDASLTVKSDVMQNASTILRQDNDAGRWSADCAFVVIPIGAARTITTTGSADLIVLRGYCPV